MSNYEFREELKPYENTHTPIIPAIVPFLQLLMSALYKMEKADEQVDVQKVKVQMEDGTERQMLVYTPKEVGEDGMACSQADGPAVFFIHGGGFAFQSAPHHFSLARRLAKELNCKVFHVDYRLAPKYKFPYAPRDCFSMYKWVVNHADELHINPEKITVCGDSAGGNLATVTAMMARDNGVQMPCAQVLLYPVTDMRMITESVKKYTDTPMCNSEDMKKYIKMYQNPASSENNAYYSPMEAESLAGMPPTYVEVAELDCLHDEGVAYAMRLQEAGIEVEIHEVKKAMHGYDIAEDSQLVKNCMEDRVAFIKKNC